MTILEMTVVLVILMLVLVILFFGATAWRRGADRTNHIVNLRNCQQAMRGHQNMQIDPSVTTFGRTELQRYMRFPDTLGDDATRGIRYTPGTIFTAKGVLWLRATYGTIYTSATFRPPASMHSEW